MNSKKDNSILKPLEEYEKELREGLKEGKLTIDDIEKLLGKHLSEIKDTMITITGDIMSEESKDGAEFCKECGKRLKKTKKEDSR